MRILFVCIGNSCRSPMAESVLKQMINQEDLEWHVDSAALRSWNVGYRPEGRCIQVLGENGLSSDHIGRKICEEDFYNFDFIFGMDHSNIDELKEIAPQNHTAKIQFLGSYGSPNDKIILDPYFVFGNFNRLQILIECLSFRGFHFPFRYLAFHVSLFLFRGIYLAIGLLGSLFNTFSHFAVQDLAETGVHGFRRCFDQITLSCKNFVKAHNK